MIAYTLTLEPSVKETDLKYGIRGESGKPFKCRLIYMCIISHSLWWQESNIILWHLAFEMET